MQFWRTGILKGCGWHEQSEGWLVVFDPQYGDWDAKLRVENMDRRQWRTWADICAS